MIESIGRFHLLLLHLPIGIFILVFLLEIISTAKKTSAHKEAITAGLFIGMCSAILSCVTGLMLSNGGDYKGDLVNAHKWFAIGLTTLSIILYILNIRKNRGQGSSLYTPLFITLMILLGVTGHKGGSITHGEGFLTGSSDDTSTSMEDVNEAIAYEEIIHPIIKTKCVSCHRSSKSKGDLILADTLGILKGGKNGPVIVQGKVSESRVIQRIHLPMEDEEHMPPNSKKQLTADEISLLEWWIDQGASFNSKIGKLEKNEDIQFILEKYSKPKSSFDPLVIEPVGDGTLKSLIQAGIPVRVIADDSPVVSVNWAHNNSLDKSLIRKLKKINQQLTSLDLSFTNVDDNMLSSINVFPHLTNLQLQGTDITTEALKRFGDLKHLKTLNVYRTKIDDQILNVVKNLPSLQSIYLWQTPVTQELVDQLRLENPLLKVVFNESADIFGDANLRPPLILASQDFFRDTLQVELKLNFKNVDFFYTLDGSDPDSTSMKYGGPFVIDETSLVKAMTKKKGWKDSEIADRQFVQSKYKIKNIFLQGGPSEKYQGSGEKTLRDFVKGTEQFTDGNWLGYEGGHLVATLDLGITEAIQSVTVSALDATNSWIFYPLGMKIKTSIDGVNFVDVKNVRYPIPESMVSASLKNFTEEFELRQARFVKIEVENILKNPAWHPNPGGKSWLFVDEILVN